MVSRAYKQVKSRGCRFLLVNLHRSTRTNEYAGMQMFLTTKLKRDWSIHILIRICCRKRRREQTKTEKRKFAS